MTSVIVDGGKENIRGIAAFTVALAHAYGIFIIPHLGGDGFMSKLIGQAAHQSVVVFFIISGLLITRSITSNIKRNSGKFDLTKYLISRISRIYPPLCFAIFISLFSLLAIKLFDLPGSSIHNPFTIGQYKPSRELFTVSAKDVANALLMRNGMLEANGPLWSLCIEWKIYIFIGFLASFFTARRICARIIIAIVTLYSFKMLFSVNEHSLFYLSIWLLGSLYSYYCIRLGSALPKLRRFLAPALMILIASSGYFRPDLLTSGGSTFGAKENLFQFLIALLWCILLAPDQVKKSTLTGIVAAWFGRLSYSLYVLHFPTMLLVLSVLQNHIAGDIFKSIGAFFISIILSVAISMFSEKFFERKAFYEQNIKVFVDLIIQSSSAALRRIKHIFNSPTPY